MRGFTLLEALMYIGLFSILISGSLAGTIAITESAERNKSKSLLDNEGAFLDSKINTDVQDASSIEYPLENIPSDHLQIRTLQGITIKISLSGTSLFRTTDLNTPSMLSCNYLTVEDLSFKEIGSGGIDPKLIQTTFTLSTKTDSGQSISEDFSIESFLLP
jgi:type II secretory pathway pseudopilin PulG